MKIVDTIYIQSIYNNINNSYKKLNVFEQDSALANQSNSLKNTKKTGYESSNYPITSYESSTYKWIENITFKRDSTGPLSADEEAYLKSVKSSLWLQQQYNNVHGIKERPALPFDEDGYPLSAYVMSAQSKMKNRELVNEQISDIFNENNIHISKGEKLTFTIDLNNYISVSGLEDLEKADKIEKLLNDRKEGRTLLQHIINSTMTINTQYTDIEMMKYRTNNDLKDYTGYSLIDLDFTDKGIFTKDGYDIKSIFDNSVNNNIYLDDMSKATVKKSMAINLKEIQRMGMDNIKDISIKIDYVNAELADVDTKFGFGSGQTDWFDKMMSLRGNMGEIVRMFE